VRFASHRLKHCIESSVRITFGLKQFIVEAISLLDIILEAKTVRIQFAMETDTVQGNSFSMLFQSLVAFLWQIYLAMTNSFSLFLHTDSDRKGSEKSSFESSELGSAGSDSLESLSPQPSNENGFTTAPILTTEEYSPRPHDIHLSISEDEIKESIIPMEIKTQSDIEVGADLEDITEEDMSNDESRTGNSDSDLPIEKSDNVSIVTPPKKKKSRRGKKKSKTAVSSPATLDSLLTPQTTPSITPQSTPSKSKQNTPIKKNQTPDNQDDRFKNFRMRRDSKSNGSGQKVNNNQVKHSSLVGKHDIQETPRRFSHSALAQKFKDADCESQIKPVRQPIGPALGTNGFSAEYQRERKERMTQLL